MTAAVESDDRKSAQPLNRPREVLAVACGAHALHDGYTDLLYVLLPLWQAEFALGYAAIGALRALYTGAMAGLQVPASALAKRFGGPIVLAAGTAIAGGAYLLAGASAGFPLLAAALILGGAGSSTQHPIASSLVARAYEGRHSRGALGTYNFAGDLGKMAVPAATAWLVVFMPWRSALLILGAGGIIAAIVIAVLLHRRVGTPASGAVEAPRDLRADAAARHSGFSILMAIGIIDSATRMGFLTFLPFLLQAKGADLPTIGLALTLIFAGGAAGKLVCAFIGARFGVLATVFLTEGLTALGILALLPLPLTAGLAVLSLIGIALNGTSSVLYGTVPELVPAARRERAFGIFYTGTIGGGAVSPVIYGFFSDAAGVPAMMAIIAAVVMLTLPLAWRLRAALAHPTIAVM
jgi:FSR family fosmidomycin resistance protein-like MFS transporter